MNFNLLLCYFLNYNIYILREDINNNGALYILYNK